MAARRRLYAQSVLRPRSLRHLRFAVIAGSVLGFFVCPTLTPIPLGFLLSYFTIPTELMFAFFLLATLADHAGKPGAVATEFIFP
jgi:hypothetical protein